MRTTVSRFGGAMPAESPARRGTQAATTGTGSLKSYVTATAALSSAEFNVLIAFLSLLGRTPDRAGLAYWAAQPSASSVTACVNAVYTAVAGSQVLDPDATVLVSGAYLHLLGKTKAEDPAGVAYWASQIGPTSIGAVVEQIASISSTAAGYFGDTYRNRMLVAESVARLQKAHSRDLSVPDSRTVALRVAGTLPSYDAAMSDVERLLVNNTASSTMAWEDTWTSASLFNASLLPDNSPVRQVRSMVWYNRSGAMMRATAYLPSNFTTGSHRAIIVAHGGGWRLGWPENMEWLSTALAAKTGQTYVVLATSYALSPFGGVTPTPENDIEDFHTLVSASAFLRCDASRVGILGESSGGHLGLLVGAKKNLWRVFALYPPANLTGTPAVSSGLEPYVNYYAPTAGNKSAASPQLAWASGRQTLFRLWHGLSDTFVPSSQSTGFVSTVGVNASVQLVSGEGHGFSTATRTSVINDAASWMAQA